MAVNDGQLNSLTLQIIQAAIEVHKTLGPGLLESTYRICTAHELMSANINVEQEVVLPVIYKGIRLEAGYRLDMVVNDLVIIEFKSVESLLPIHEAQVISYLKLSGLKVGLLINFNVRILKSGIRRLVNNFRDENFSSSRISL